MGKGIALQAKKIHPKMYDEYKKLCSKHEMRLGTPVIFDEQQFSTNEKLDNSYKKILLFPTKYHWRNSSDLIDIKNGLKWLLENYDDKKITSIALPALGCGYGGLPWKQVEPVMITCLKQMGITCELYSP